MYTNLSHFYCLFIGRSQVDKQSATSLTRLYHIGELVTTKLIIMVQFDCIVSALVYTTLVYARNLRKDELFLLSI